MLCLSNNIEKIWSMECWFSLLDNEFFLFIICIHLLYVNHICSQDKIKFHLSAYLYVFSTESDKSSTIFKSMLFTHAHCLWSKLSDQTLVYTLRCLYIYIYIHFTYLWDIFKVLMQFPAKIYSSFHLCVNRVWTWE